MRARLFVWAVIAGLAGAVPAFAQVAPTASRVWVDFNVGPALSGAGDVAFRFENDQFFEELLVLEARYPKPSGAFGFDVGGGVLMTPVFGIGVSIARARHEDAAELFMEVPHPGRFDLSASDTDDSAPLERTERAVHVQASYLLRRDGPVSVRVFGGPTFFNYSADMVRDIQAEQIATLDPDTNQVTITGEDVVRAEASAVGFHAGVDLGYFFTRTIGVGGVVRFSRGTVTLDEEPMSEAPQDITVGGFSVGGGIRIRF